MLMFCSVINLQMEGSSGSPGPKTSESLEIRNGGLC